MSYSIDDFRTQAKKYATELDLQQMINSIDFSKVDAKKLKKIDFSKGLESARHQLEQLPKVRITTQPVVVVPEPEENDGGFVGGLLLGMVLGAILALLFAPKSGEETRELVASSVGDLKSKVAGDPGFVQDEIIEPVETAADDAATTLTDEPAIERNYGE
jgi:hypothetical protein